MDHLDGIKINLLFVFLQGENNNETVLSFGTSFRFPFSVKSGSSFVEFDKVSIYLHHKIRLVSR